MLNLACNRVERFNFGTDLHSLTFTKINDYAVLGLSASAQSLLMLNAAHVMTEIMNKHLIN